MTRMTNKVVTVKDVEQQTEKKVRKELLESKSFEVRRDVKGKWNPEMKPVTVNSTDLEDSVGELLSVVVRKKRHQRDRPEKVKSPEAPSKATPAVTSDFLANQPGLNWQVYDLAQFVDIPDDILEVMACPRTSQCGHDHSKYRLVGSKIYVCPEVKPEDGFNQARLGQSRFMARDGKSSTQSTVPKAQVFQSLAPTGPIKAQIPAVTDAPMDQHYPEVQPQGSCLASAIPGEVRKEPEGFPLKGTNLKPTEVDQSLLHDKTGGKVNNVQVQQVSTQVRERVPPTKTPGGNKASHGFCHCEERMVRTTKSTVDGLTSEVHISTSRQVTASTMCPACSDDSGTNGGHKSSPVSQRPVAPPPRGYHVRKDYSSSEASIAEVKSNPTYYISKPHRSKQSSKHSSNKVAEGKEAHKSKGHHGSGTDLTKHSRGKESTGKNKKLMIIGKLNYLNVQPKHHSSKAIAKGKIHKADSKSGATKQLELLTLPTSRAWVRSPRSRHTKCHHISSPKAMPTSHKRKRSDKDTVFYYEPLSFCQKYSYCPQSGKYLGSHKRVHNQNGNALFTIRPRYSIHHRYSRLAGFKRRRNSRFVGSSPQMEQGCGDDFQVSPMCHLNMNSNAGTTPEVPVLNNSQDALNDTDVSTSISLNESSQGQKPRSTIGVIPKGSSACRSLPGKEKSVDVDGKTSDTVASREKNGPSKRGQAKGTTRTRGSKTAEALLIKVETKKIVTTRVTKKDTPKAPPKERHVAVSQSSDTALHSGPVEVGTALAPRTANETCAQHGEGKDVARDIKELLEKSVLVDATKETGTAEKPPEIPCELGITPETPVTAAATPLTVNKKVEDQEENSATEFSTAADTSIPSEKVSSKKGSKEKAPSQPGLCKGKPPKSPSLNKKPSSSSRRDSRSRDHSESEASARVAKKPSKPLEQPTETNDQLVKLDDEPTEQVKLDEEPTEQVRLEEEPTKIVELEEEPTEEVEKVIEIPKAETAKKIKVIQEKGSKKVPAEEKIGDATHSSLRPQTPRKQGKSKTSKGAHTNSRANTKEEVDAPKSSKAKSEMGVTDFDTASTITVKIQTKSKTATKKFKKSPSSKAIEKSPNQGLSQEERQKPGESGDAITGSRMSRKRKRRSQSSQGATKEDKCKVKRRVKSEGREPLLELEQELEETVKEPQTCVELQEESIKTPELSVQQEDCPEPEKIEEEVPVEIPVKTLPKKDTKPIHHFPTWKSTIKQDERKEKNVLPQKYKRRFKLQKAAPKQIEVHAEAPPIQTAVPPEEEAKELQTNPTSVPTQTEAEPVQAVVKAEEPEELLAPLGKNDECMLPVVEPVACLVNTVEPQVSPDVGLGEAKSVQFSDDVVAWEVSPSIQLDFQGLEAVLPGEPQYIDEQNVGETLPVLEEPEENKEKESLSGQPVSLPISDSDSLPVLSSPQKKAPVSKKKKSGDVKRTKKETQGIKVTSQRRSLTARHVGLRSAPESNLPLTFWTQKDCRELKKLKTLLEEISADLTTRQLIPLRGTPVDLKEISGGSPVDSPELIACRKKLIKSLKEAACLKAFKVAKSEQSLTLKRRETGLKRAPVPMMKPGLKRSAHGAMTGVLENLRERPHTQGPKSLQSPCSSVVQAVIIPTSTMECLEQCGPNPSPSTDLDAASTDTVRDQRQQKKIFVGKREPRCCKKSRPSPSKQSPEDWTPLPEPPTAVEVLEQAGNYCSDDEGCHLSLSWLAQSVITGLGALSPRRKVRGDFTNPMDTTVDTSANKPWEDVEAEEEG